MKDRFGDGDDSMESANVTPECGRERHGDEQDRASGGANFFDRMSACAPSGLRYPCTLCQGQCPEFYSAVQRASRRKVRAQRSGDCGELHSAADGTSSAVKVTL